MSVANTIALPFDLLHLVKECQLQHGLRTSDYARYHKYLTNRLATVRKQLGFKSQEGAGRKGQVSKYKKNEVTPEMLLSTVPAPAAEQSSTPSSTTALAFKLDSSSGTKAATHGCGGGRYLELLALSAERCLAIYEDAVKRTGKLEAGSATTQGAALGASGGNNPSAPDLVDARKKLNKAVKWSEQLFAIATSVHGSSAPKEGAFTDFASAAAACVVLSCEGYMYEVKGRCVAGHVNSSRVDSSPSELFILSRESYAKAAEAINAMLKFSDKDSSKSSNGIFFGSDTVSAEQSFSLLVGKLSELDDRILFAFQKQSAGQAFKPAPLPKLYVKTSTSTTMTSDANLSGSGSKGNKNLASDEKEYAITTAFLTPQSTIQWMAPLQNKKTTGTDAASDEIVVYSIKVKENLREAAAVGAPEAMRAAVGAATLTAASAASSDSSPSSSTTPPLSPSAVTASHIISVGQQLRIVDLYDRAIGYLNDALTHARSELRSAQGDASRRLVQRLTLFIQFYISRLTADRTFFVIECLARRFWFHRNLKTIGGCGLGESEEPSTSPAAADASSASALKYALKKRRAAARGSNKRIPTASPLEIIRLYVTAQDQITDCYQTPGVEGSDSPIAQRLEEEINACKVGRLLYAGEAWAIAGNYAAALQCLNVAKKHATFCLAERKNQKKSGGNDVVVVEDASKLLSAAMTLDFLAHRVSLSAVTVVAGMNLAESSAATSPSSPTAGEAKELAATRFLVDDLSSERSYTIVTEKKRAAADHTSAGSSTNSGGKQTKQQTSSSSSPSGATTTVVSANLVALPPTYMPIPAKPAFVDIAATFVDFGSDFSGPSRAKDHTSTTKHHHHNTHHHASGAASKASKSSSEGDSTKQQQQQQKSGGGGWLGAWGWGKK